MNASVLTAVALTCLASLSQPVAAAPFKLSAADPDTTKRVEAAAAASGLRQPAAFAKQSFQVSQDGAVVGTLVSGRATATAPDGHDNATCFAAMARGDAATELLRTVGAGDWEAESCIAVEAVGVLPNQAAPAVARIGIIYQAASPNATALEPVVLVWDDATHRLGIDAAASRKASLAGATSLPALQRLLR